MALRTLLSSHFSRLEISNSAAADAAKTAETAGGTAKSDSAPKTRPRRWPAWLTGWRIPEGGFGQPVNWIAADIVRLENGLLVEHWDVIQDEATRASSKSGLPMFGEAFPQ